MPWNDALAADLETAAHGLLELTGGVGMALAVFGARQSAARAVGLENLHRRRRLSRNARMPFGSVSKLIAAIAVLQCERNGLLSRDDPVGLHLDELRDDGRYAGLTLRHLLTHTSGLLDLGRDTPGSLAQAVRSLRRGPQTPPGSRVVYANTGYQVLGLVLERAIGVPYLSHLRARLLPELGMRTAVAGLLPGAQPPLASGYAANGLTDWTPARWIRVAEPLELSADVCVGGTLADLVALGRRLLADPEVEACLRVPAGARLPRSGRLGAWLAGAWFGHSGSLPGYAAGLWCNRASDIGLAALANASIPIEAVFHTAAPALDPAFAAAGTFPLGQGAPRTLGETAGADAPASRPDPAGLAPLCGSYVSPVPPRHPACVFVESGRGFLRLGQDTVAEIVGDPGRAGFAIRLEGRRLALSFDDYLGRTPYLLRLDGLDYVRLCDDIPPR